MINLIVLLLVLVGLSSPTPMDMSALAVQGIQRTGASSVDLQAGACSTPIASQPNGATSSLNAAFPRRPREARVLARALGPPVLMALASRGFHSARYSFGHHQH